LDTLTRKKETMKNLSVITLSAALLLGLSACSGGAPTGEASQPASAPAAAPAPAPKAEEPSATTGTSKFGQVWKYDDGLTITVSKPVAGTATETATAPGKPLSIYTVTIVNGSKEALKPLAYPTVNYGAEGVSAEQVYDTAQGLGDTFDNTILPGKRATVKYAFDMPTTAKDVIFSITPDLSHSDAIFTN
jgi:hypothetical protein